MDNYEFEFGGDWTERKLDVLSQYLKAWAKVLSNQRFTRCYIDAFAGTGYRTRTAEPELDYGQIFAAEDDVTGEASQRFLAGSARIALEVTPPFQRYVFIERDAARAAELERLKLDFPQHATAIDIQCRDANEAVQALCKLWERRHMRGMMFLDPFGMQLEWQTLHAVAETGTIDVWILFPFCTNRLLKKTPQSIPAGWQRRLSAMFGSDEWITRFYRQRTIETLFSGSETVVEKQLSLSGLGAYYQERLQSVFPKVAANPAELRNTRGSPIFQLFFAAGNPGRGGDIALRIAQHILTKM